MFNVIYVGGTKGAFLCYFLCRFSKYEGPIAENPFSTDGTVHRSAQFYGALPHYHEDYITRHPNVQGLPCVVPSLNTWPHYLYWLLSSKIRAGNVGADPDLLWQKTKSECKKIKGLEEDAWNLQNMHYVGHADEKFTKTEIRNWYKQHFDNDLEDFGMYKSHKEFENNKWFGRQKTKRFDFEAFYDWRLFKEEISLISDMFSLEIDFTRENEMIELYDQSIANDNLMAQVNEIKKVLAKIKAGEHAEVPKLNVVCEAFLQAQVEKIKGTKIIIGDEFCSSTKGLMS